MLDIVEVGAFHSMSLSEYYILWYMSTESQGCEVSKDSSLTHSIELVFVSGEGSNCVSCEIRTKL
jgi:hypothetical protein